MQNAQLEILKLVRGSETHFRVTLLRFECLL